ncbi:glucokinase [bacterium]|nr:glucokinase [bacterium]MBU1993416.1 glucokinase [bacterium]
MILAGDIGGTKTNLALYELLDGRLEIVVQHQFGSMEFPSFTDVIVAFKERTSMQKIDKACFGIAGPVIDGRCRTTNLPWDITTSELQKHLGVEKIRLLNDLEATAYGMLYLSGDEFADINPSGREVKGNIAVIAAGTGLGEAMLFWDGEQYHPIGSEGGHTDFAPSTIQQDNLLQWLRKRYPEHVSNERILSGPGIYTLYEFLYESGFAPQPDFMLNIKEDKDKSAMVSEGALMQKDSLCMETLRLFAEIYAAEAGNLALKTMSLGGVYIGGGIAPKILPFLENDDFINSFASKGRFEGLLRGMKVKVSLNTETALLGAARFAFDKL